MTEVIRQKLVAFMSETTRGTNPFSGTPTEFLSIIDWNMRPIRGRIANESTHAVHSGAAHKTFPSHCEITGSGYVTGKSGAAGTTPALAALLKSCGHAETIVADTSASYRPVTTHSMAICPTGGCYYYERQTDGTYRLYQSFGIRGNLTFTWEMGLFLRWDFEGRGSYVAPGSSTIAGPSDPEAYSGGKSPLAVDGLTFQVGGSDFEMSKFDVATNWSLEDVRTATGSSQLDYIEAVRASDGHVPGNIEFMKSDEFETVLTNHGADTEFAVAASVTDGTDTVAFAAPKGQFDQWTMNAGNLGSFGVPVLFNGEWGGGESGDNDYTLTFT